MSKKSSGAVIPSKKGAGQRLQTFGPTKNSSKADLIARGMIQLIFILLHQVLCPIGGAGGARKSSLK
jgi:hypothetical protein